MVRNFSELSKQNNFRFESKFPLPGDENWVFTPESYYLAFRVLSPCGLDMEFSTETYSTEEKAKQAIADFVKRHESQGYYASSLGPIPVDELAKHCRIILA